MASRAPALSVVMQSHHAAAYITEAIESILSQTYSDFELIIVDGASADGTADVIRRAARRDARIRPVLLSRRYQRGPCANLGIALARAPLVARMDADDIALPDRFRQQLDWMRVNDVDVCGAHAVRFGARTELLTFPETHAGIAFELCFRAALLNQTTISRTRVLRASPYGRTAFEDYELWVRLAATHRMGNVPEVLLRYRAHAGQCTTLERRDIHRDLARYRFRHFYRMFPGTPMAEYLPIARMSDRLPMESLAQLECAARWLIRLSEPPDLSLRARMLRRWRDTCEASAALGDEVMAIRSRYETILDSLVCAMQSAA